jgi:hypothetical protein
LIKKQGPNIVCRTSRINRYCGLVKERKKMD